jgi:uncharacterized paraquat-inducible protein A
MKPALDDRGAIVACPSCGTANRLAYATLDKRTRCPRCKALLTAPDVPFDVPSMRRPRIA